MRKLEGIDAYPLSWPMGWVRTRSPERSRFKIASFARVRDGLVHQLSLMGIADYNVIISTNIPLKRDGLPYASFRPPDDKGVAVYWWDKRRKAQRCMACDKFDRVRDNMHAIEKSIDALRGLARWGTSEIIDRAFQGFAALPPASEDWRSILGFSAIATPTLDEVRAYYRDACRSVHPDRPDGGNPDQMARFNAAMAAAEVELS